MRRFVFSGVFLLVFLSGALLWSQGTPDWQQVGVLASDTSAGESMLKVNWTGTGTAGVLVMIQDRDDEGSEVVEVRHIYGDYLILKKQLTTNFLAGSRLYQ